MRILVMTVMIVAAVVFGFMSPVLAQTIKRGTITGQSVKWTTGSVRIVKTPNGHEIRLGGDFKTKRGPSLWIYLGNNRPEKRVGRLKTVSGAQVYQLPDSVKPEDYTRLFIHCVPFNATFGSAALR